MSGFLVKLDENLGRSHLKLLRGHGYDVETVHGERLSGFIDASLARAPFARYTLQSRGGFRLRRDRTRVPV